MLIRAKKLRDISFSRLMAVYAEGNLENGQEFWPDLSPGQQLMNAEQGFFQYLQEDFFRQPGAVYCIWEENGIYVSALRLEPYLDGLLLEALETAPDMRRKGFGEKLIRAMLQQYGHCKIYSHVGKWNEASLKVHEKCGFRRIKEYAAYIDGSVNQRSCTMVYEEECTCS